MVGTKKTGFIVLFCVIGSLAWGQVAEDSELFITLRQNDSILFDAAFDRCDTATLEKIFTDDFEFYHDKGGLTIGRDNFLNPMKEGCAKRNPEDLQYSKRILVENTLEVYPMYKDNNLYGAIQQGIHRFEFLNENQEYEKGDIAKFTHVWVKENDSWKIKRELSYDHQDSNQ